ncbi:MAG: nitrite reductase (NAD(P)H) [Planctomycetota bacterium]|nr:MAG: nitrite reductase (NAD(P)H) [Planctomycetota bacterium]
MIEKKNLVVVGNGMVGYKFCEKFIDASTDGEYQVITFGDEPRPAYDRVHLSSWFDGKSADDLLMQPEDWYAKNGIELLIGEKVIAIDHDKQTISTDQDQEIPYNTLVLATGSFPFVPPIPGKDKKGVFVYRTIEDLVAIKSFGSKVKTAAVIGGGLLGLEAAKALVDLGLKTHVVEFAPRLMPRQIDDEGSRYLEDKIKKLGVDIHLNVATKEIIGDNNVTGLLFSNDELLDVDMVVISAGIRPRDELAKKAGIQIGERGGIVVNDFLETSVKNIYAIGECALHDGMIYGLVAPGYRMAETAVSHILEGDKSFTGMDMSTKLKLMGVDVSNIGDPFLDIDNITNIVLSNETTGVYKKLVIDKSSWTLKGAILVGDNNDYNKLYQYYLNQKKLPESPESLIVIGSDDEATTGVDALDSSAQICSCENITKGEIVAAIQSGNDTLPSIKSCTKAGTGCGSCVTLINDIVASELSKIGKEISKNICEHFDYSRVELVEIIKTKKIQSFKELINSHGNGHGCELCKPVVASILASYVNEYILDERHRTLQDSNDRFLANIQKNGTYSIVPRIPGGEITPDQLIVIGEVAKNFNLYTKITGGQRIDLFGAQKHDLPVIWQKLASVNLESGHAYAKSLRTVKSCVGNVWCRFGVQDSTGLAIEIENRYKGIRAPHKIKMAVSGCARECAEAQSKDAGIIATENGWNLYVCGNGGMKPQHAQLLAVDIDKETLIKYIDRFFMYYIRTADKLTRTASWLNKLEGGLEHLKDVVINDSLNINADLENEMAHLVKTYKCEWQVTLESPERMKAFETFVNTSGKDETIMMREERGQIRPLNEDEDNKLALV